MFSPPVDQQIRVRWEVEGPQLGAYFGAAVATGDVNDDGWSELFVGAPMFANIGEKERDILVTEINPNYLYIKVKIYQTEGNDIEDISNKSRLKVDMKCK